MGVVAQGPAKFTFEDGYYKEENVRGVFYTRRLALCRIRRWSRSPWGTDRLRRERLAQ